MILRCSRFVHYVPVGEARILILHAINHMRLPADPDVGKLLDFFATPKRVPEDCGSLSDVLSFDLPAILAAIRGLTERGILTEKSPEEEQAEASAALAPTHGRDPAQMLEDYRRQSKEGAMPYWAAGASYGVNDLSAKGERIDILLFGDCDIQMESDFLRQEAAKRGIDLRVAATFPDDVRFASEHKHDAIIIGALRARHTITDQPPAGQAPHAGYIVQAHRLLQQLRERSAAPILIDNLPEPTVQPIGMAEHGLSGHRTRFRYANVALAEVAALIPDTHVIDIDAALSGTGMEKMLDDGMVGFTHFGSPGWLLQRPNSERAAVHNIFPELQPLADRLGSDPYAREKITSSAHIDALMTALGLRRKKCVILDLDNTLWPGVLAETGSPFAWTPEISGSFSYIGYYFGLHEALLCLKKRGIVLACVSKNDEATVRELWKYPDNYPQTRLLKPDDFVTWRIDWNDKVDNIRSIAEELGFDLSTFLFIDDHPVERDRVRQRLPEVEVWGDDPFELRRRLLTDPRLQVPKLTEEAANRSTLVKAQIDRHKLQAEMMDEDAYIASLNIRCVFTKETSASPRLPRVEELFQRTTQFNTTGRKFTSAGLKVLADGASSLILTLDVADRFGDHGLVGGAIVDKGEIIGLALSCRVLGMGVEHQFIRHILAAAAKIAPEIRGQIIPTSRNNPVRNIYRDNGFSEISPGLWTYTPPA